MSFPATDCFGLQKSGLLEVCYRGNIFTICRVAQWAYMAVMVVADTTENEDAEYRVSSRGAMKFLNASVFGNFAF